MAVITIPENLYFAKLPKFVLLRAGQSLRSKYTGKRQHINFPFAMWNLEGTLTPKTGIDAGDWRAFFVELEGEKNTFRLPIPGFDGPISGYTGNGILKTTVNARAKSFTVRGLEANREVFSRGDYITINDECKMVTGYFSSNSSGESIITFEPGMRETVQAGATVEMQSPWIYMSASNPDSASWELDRPVEHTFKIYALEAIE